MSTAIAKNFQVGNDSTATNNFTIRQPATPDGTVRIANGNTGTTTDLVTINSAGQTTITGNAIINSNTASDALRITQTGAGNALVVEDSTNPDATPFVIDASGNVFKGYTASISTPFPLGFQINGTAGDSGMSLTRWVASTANPAIYLAKSRGAAVGTRGIVSSGDNIGSIDFTADDGANFVPAAAIVAAVDGTPGTNDMPGNLRFNTTADGASATTERMRIDSAGRVGIGITPSGGQFGDRLQIGLTTSSTTSVTSFYNQLNVSATSGSGAYAAVNSLTVANATFAGTGALIGTNSAVASQTTNTVADVRLYSGTYSTTGGGAVTNLYNYLSNPATLTSGTVTNHFGFYSNIASGTGRWNFYANGTASNYFAGPVQLAAGTAAAPSLTAFGDTNTGLFYPAADTVGISTGGTERLRIDPNGNLQVQAGAVVVYQPTPASIATTATLTNADIQAQIINTTGTSYTVTMPLGTTLETLVTWAAINLGYDFSIINTASGTITMAANTGVSTFGAMTIATGTSAQFRIRRTAANTFVMYRLS